LIKKLRYTIQDYPKGGTNGNLQKGGAGMIINANALHIPLADGSVHTIVTSPPY